MQYAPTIILTLIAVGLLVTGIIFLRSPFRLGAALNSPSQRRTRPERNYSEKSLRSMAIVITVIGAVLTAVAGTELVREIVVGITQ